MMLQSTRGTYVSWLLNLQKTYQYQSWNTIENTNLQKTYQYQSWNTIENTK